MDFNNILKQAKELKTDLEQKQKEFADKQFQGTSGGGLVTATLNGQGKALKFQIDPKFYDNSNDNKVDYNMLEDLIVAAFNSAKTNLDNESSELMSGFGGNMNMPDLNKIFG